MTRVPDDPPRRRLRHSVLWFFLAFVGFSVAANLQSCAATMPDPVHSEASEAPDELWDAYVASYSGVALQENCVPRIYDPPPDVARRGAVMLYHGYFSCPQQYFELGPRLAAEGFRVYTPLLPGHGVAYDDPAEDDYSGLPVTGNWKRVFPEFVDRMNAVMAEEEGERVVGGLSVGASLAVLSVHRAAEPYDRAWLLVPFLGAPGGGFAGGAVAVISRTPIFRETNLARLGWHTECVSKRLQGRAGLCNYRAKHLGAITALGRWNVRQAELAPLPLPIQIMAIDNDNSVSEARIRRFEAAQAEGAGLSSCMLHDTLPHSLLSREDNPGKDMYWLPWVLDVTEAWLVSGTEIPERVEDGQEPLGWCAIPLAESQASAAP